MVLKRFLYFASIICTAWTYINPHEVCRDASAYTFAKPDNCAQFYNCELSPSSYPLPDYLGDYVDECPYPKLFSVETGSCEDFKDVECGQREEIVYACDYKKNQCIGGRCKPCVYSYPDCRELPDGHHVWAGMQHTQMYAACYRGRGFAKSCYGYDGREFFSAVTKRCEPVQAFMDYFGSKRR